MSDYDTPDAEHVALHLGTMVALQDFEVVNFRHPKLGVEAFALVRRDGTVWIVTVQEGKLELAR